jgi:hypothetical protein
MSAGFVRTGGQAHAGNMDVFLTSYTPTGQLRCSVLLGGPNYDRSYWLDIAPDGDPVVGGRAGINFPTTLGPPFGAYPVVEPAYGPQKPFVARFAPDCTLRWAQFLDGDGRTISRDGAVGPSGIYAGLAHVSTDLYFVPPTAIDPIRNGVDGALAFISHDGLTVTGTYYGGVNQDGNNPSVRVDASGVYWLTTSRSPDFPVSSGAAQADCGTATSQRLAVIKLSLNLGTRLYATCGVGGTVVGGFETHHLAIQPDGSAVMSFYTPGQQATTPGVIQPTFGGGVNDIGIAVLNPTGTQFTAVSHFGGPNQDWPEGIAVLPDGRIVMSGQTQSSAALIPGACGNQDAFLAVLSADLTRVDMKVRYCGPGNDQGRIVEVYDTNRVIWGGMTDNTVPVVNGPQMTRGGGWDGFWGIATVPPPPAVDPCVLNPTTASVTFPIAGQASGLTWLANKVITGIRSVSWSSITLVSADGCTVSAGVSAPAR